LTALLFLFSFEVFRVAGFLATVFLSDAFVFLSLASLLQFFFLGGFFEASLFPGFLTFTSSSTTFPFF